MEIKSISGRIFKTSQNRIEQNENASSHTNPFGVSFKGNIIHADVFESAKSEAQGSKWIQRASEKSRMAMGAIIGSFGSVNQAFSARMDSIVSFGRKIRQNVAGAWNYLNNTNLRMSFDLVKREAGNLINSNILARKTGSIEKLRKLGVSELEGLLQEGIAARAV